MVSKKTILGYEFSDIYEYFDYIVTSRINGQIKQAKDLYKKLSKKQKTDFWNWFDASYYYDSMDNDEPNYVNDLKTILLG
jgi:hypothetical protein